MSKEKQRLLIVDDEPVIRLFLQELFEDEGYEVLTAQSIAEGLEKLRDNDLNLVLTDKNLPDGTGFEIVHAAKEQDPPCEAILITGYASLDSAVMALQIGAYDYILKPIEDVDLLLEKARKAIEKQDLACELADLRKAHAALTGANPPSSAEAEGETAADSPLAELACDLPQLMKLAELGSLIPMLSHELRQPLAGVKGYIDLILHKRDIDPALRPKLEAVQAQVVHMARLIESIMGYARVSTGQSLVDVRRPIQQALAIFPVLDSRGRYEVSVDLPEQLPSILANPNALQQVIVNLVKNAKDALDEIGGGNLLLRAWHDEEADQIRIRIEDSGKGISDEVREKLYQPFFTTKKEGVGTGLGLTICRQIINDLGGRIELQTPLGPEGGTAFTLVFAVAREAAMTGR